MRLESRSVLRSSAAQIRRLAVVSLLALLGLGGPVAAVDTPEEAVEAWQAMRFGLFIHWGVYSIPAGIWEGRKIEKLGEQIQRHADISMDDYEGIARQFNPIEFDADKIVQLAKRAGMRYVVLTAKHHDGFAMFDSRHTDFDVVDFTPYKKDILKELADACARHDLKLGIYYSTPDWHFNGPNPERNPRDGKISVFAPVSKANEDYQVAQLEELLTNYGEVVELFFDMGEPTPEQSKRFRDTVKRLQPNTLINGRVMNEQGDFLTMPDNHVPDTPITELPWETPGTFYHTWGYKSWVKGAPLNEQVRRQVRKLSSISSMGGNFLLNIGPKSDGNVVVYERQVLDGVGEWVDVHEEAIFGTGLNPFNRLDWGFASTGKQVLYLHVHRWPEDGKLRVPGLTNDVTAAYFLHERGLSLQVSTVGEDKLIDLAVAEEDPRLSIVAIEYSGDLSIIPARSRPAGDGIITLPGSKAVRHGKVGRESYRSLLKDFYRSWTLDIPAPARYMVEISYRLPYEEKDFIVAGSADEQAVSLQGSDDWTTATFGPLAFDAPGIQDVFMRQGRPFELKARSADFHAQDPKYRAMKLDIRAIRLLPVRELDD